MSCPPSKFDESCVPLFFPKLKMDGGQQHTCSTDHLCCGLVACDTVWLCRWLPTFQRKVLPPSSRYNMGALVRACEAAWRSKTQDQNMNFTAMKPHFSGEFIVHKSYVCSVHSGCCCCNCHCLALVVAQHANVVHHLLCYPDS